MGGVPRGGGLGGGQINRKYEKSRVLIMYLNPRGVGIWDLALIPHKMPDYYIIFFI